MMKKSIVFASLVVGLFGCATIEKLSPREFLKVSQREYSGIESYKILDNVDVIMRLVDDPGSVTVGRSVDRIESLRVVPLANATLVLEFSVENRGPDTVKTYLLSKFIAGGRSMIMQNSGDYNLFYDRLDSLLFEKPWVTCEQAKNNPTKYSPPIRAMCDSADDFLPGPESDRYGPMEKALTEKQERQSDL